MKKRRSCEEMENPAFAGRRNGIVAKIENKCDSDVWKYKLLYYIVVSGSEWVYVCVFCVCVHVCVCLLALLVRDTFNSSASERLRGFAGAMSAWGPASGGSGGIRPASGGVPEDEGSENSASSISSMAWRPTLYENQQRAHSSYENQQRAIELAKQTRHSHYIRRGDWQTGPMVWDPKLDASGNLIPWHTGYTPPDSDDSCWDREDSETDQEASEEEESDEEEQHRRQQEARSRTLEWVWSTMAVLLPWATAAVAMILRSTKLAGLWQRGERNRSGCTSRTSVAIEEKSVSSGVSAIGNIRGQQGEGKISSASGDT